VDVPNAASLSADMLAAAISERLNGRLAQIEERARQTLRDAVRSTACCLEPVCNRRTRDVVANFARLPTDLENRILAAYSTLPLSERQEFDFDRLVLGLAADQAITELAEGASVLTRLRGFGCFDAACAFPIKRLAGKVFTTGGAWGRCWW
jgi:hypothetical protein